MYILARHDKPENWHRTARQLATYPTDSAQQAVPPEGDNGDPDDRHNNDDKPRQPVRALAHRELFITPFRIGTSGTGSYEGCSYQSSLTSQSPDPTDQRPVNDVPDDASAFRESSVPRCTMCPVHLPLEMGQSSHFVHTGMEVLCHRD